MTDMGCFYTTVKVENHHRRGEMREIAHVLVDTGAETTWIPRPILESLGIEVEERFTYVMADGRELTRDVGYAIIHVAGRKTTDEVVFAEPDDLSILGARAMEGLSLRIDPREKLLVSSGPKLVALAI